MINPFVNNLQFIITVICQYHALFKNLLCFGWVAQTNPSGSKTIYLFHTQVRLDGIITVLFQDINMNLHISFENRHNSQDKSYY